MLAAPLLPCAALSWFVIVVRLLLRLSTSSLALAFQLPTTYYILLSLQAEVSVRVPVRNMSRGGQLLAVEGLRWPVVLL